MRVSPYDLGMLTGQFWAGGHPHPPNSITKVLSKPALIPIRDLIGAPRWGVMPNPPRTNRGYYRGVLFVCNSRSKPRYFTFIIIFRLLEITWRIKNLLIINYKQNLIKFLTIILYINIDKLHRQKLQLIKYDSKQVSIFTILHLTKIKK